jgi:hypothetical protein
MTRPIFDFDPTTIRLLVLAVVLLGGLLGALLGAATGAIHEDNVAAADDAADDDALPYRSVS